MDASPTHEVTRKLKGTDIKVEVGYDIRQLPHNVTAATRKKKT